MVLLAARGCSNEHIAATLNTGPHTVARWRRRFLDAGLPGIADDKPRAGRPRSATGLHEERVLSATHNARPPDGQRWSTRSLAEHLGIAHMLVARVWKRAGISPPRWKVTGSGDSEEVRWQRS